MLPPNSKIRKSYIIVHKHLTNNKQYYLCRSVSVFDDNFDKAKIFKRKSDASCALNYLKTSGSIWTNDNEWIRNVTNLEIKVVYVLYNENLQ